MDAMDMRGKVAVIAGPTAGIGQELAIELAGRGATVVLAARNENKAKATIAVIKKKHHHATVEIAPLVDMEQPDSIKEFARHWHSSNRKIHILVNNAGSNLTARRYTESGVPIMCEINYLGPYLLTRLLEDVLIRSRARIVHVSSILHRIGTLGDEPKADFLLGDFGFSYANTKLANCLFGYEMQRRMGRYDVQSVVVDPGAVNSNIWREFPGLVKTLVSSIYAPTSEGAKPLVMASVVDWTAEAGLPPTRPQPALASRAFSLIKNSIFGVMNYAKAETAHRKKHHYRNLVHVHRNKPPDLHAAAPPAGPSSSVIRRQPAVEEDLRYFAPEAFGLPIITWFSVEGHHGPVGRFFMRNFGIPITHPFIRNFIKESVWLILATTVSTLDWPLRQLSGGRLGGVKSTHSSPLSYNRALAAQLWDDSADVCGLPREVQVKKQAT